MRNMYEAFSMKGGGCLGLADPIPQLASKMDKQAKSPVGIYVQVKLGWFVYVAHCWLSCSWLS